MSGVPALCDRVPAGLFGPLAGGHAPLYWSILACLFDAATRVTPLVAPGSSIAVADLLP
jgi:hypothetical protein